MIIHDGKPFEEIDGLYKGHVILGYETLIPKLEWCGTRIPWNLYCQWVAFCRWGKEEGHEVQLKPIYNVETKVFDTLVYPQKCSSAGTEVIADHPDIDEIEKPLNEGFDIVGSVHSHPGEAFQSSTDKKDEEEGAEPGLHITLGNLDKTVIDIHTRLVFRKFKYSNSSLESFFETPLTMSGSVPAELQEAIAKYYLVHSDPIDFPDEWKDRIHTNKSVVIGGFRGPNRNTSIVTSGNQDPVARDPSDNSSDYYENAFTASLMNLMNTWGASADDLQDAINEIELDENIQETSEKRTIDEQVEEWEWQQENRIIT